MDVKQTPKQTAISAVVIRADGTRENLGIVAYHHKNPLRRLQFAIMKRLGRRVDDSFFH